MASQALLVFTATKARTAAAVFERLFPADGRRPGARDIGVVEYVDRALGGFDQQLATALDGAACGFQSLRQHGRRARPNSHRIGQDELVEASALGRLTSPFGADEQNASFEQVRAYQPFCASVPSGQFTTVSGLHP